MNWYYIDGPQRVGPLGESEWAELVRSGKVTPETLVWHEGMEKWTPYRQVVQEVEPPALDEQEETLPGEKPQVVEDPRVFAARVADQDFSVPVGECVSRAWAIYKRYFWMLVGSTLLTLVLVGVGSQIPLVGVIIPMALQGVFLGGLYLVFFRLMRGEAAEISDLFAGFSAELFKPLALQTLVAYLVSQLCFLPAVIAFKMKGVEMQKLGAVWADDPNTFYVLLLVLLACLIPVVYFGFCWMFSVPLIVDKKLPFWPAMQLSRAKVLQHPWRIGVLALVAGVLGCVGIFGFFIGIFLTLPLNYLVLLFQYEEMFNTPASKPDAPAE